MLDPACGSGIFLVQALRQIIEKYKDSNSGRITKEKLIQLAEENIYGIDQDKKAINVAIFSVYLTLLDHQDPSDIEKFTFPKLKETGNFHDADFFNKKAKYNTNFKKINFDFILGNPPWGRGLSGGLPEEYIDDRKTKETHQDNNAPEIAISNKEIAQPFLIRTSDFSSQTTQCALIVTSKVLYNLKADKFRKYFLHNFFIKKVFELAPVKEEVFESAQAPATILFFKYAHQKDTSQNTIMHLCLKPNRLFSLFKIFVLQRPDIKRVMQKRLMEYDWLWKVLVYGSYLDFNFLKSLKEEYPSIKEKIEQDNLLYGQGILANEGDRIDSSHLVGKKLLEHNDVEQFFVKNNLNTFNKLHIHRPRRRRELFMPPALLIKEGLNNKLQLISGIKYDHKIFTGSFTAIVTTNISLLRIFNALLNSKLTSYIFLSTGSCIGIDRDQVHDEEKWEIPFSDNKQLSSIVEKIEKTAEEIYQRQPLSSSIGDLETTQKELIENLNKEIFKTFNLYEQELTLIDYATEITIPIIKKHRGYEEFFSSIDSESNILKNYANVFLARFEDSFTQKHLEVDIWHSEYIVGMFFKVLPDDNENKEKIKPPIEKDNNIFLQYISELGIEKISEKLFIQKDIRGFETNSFYIIKPNEKKLWHKAIAYLDVNEFADAMLRAGKKSYNG